MALVSLYVPDGVPRDFLTAAEDSQLVRLVSVLTEPHALFDRTDSCACSTRHGLAIRGRSVMVPRDGHAVVGYPLYALPPDCTSEETNVVVTWLSRHRMKTFRSVVEIGGPYVKHYDKEETLKRTLGPATHDGLFRKTRHGECCEIYTLEKDPVFMLKSVVLSIHGRGPTLESACRSNEKC